MLFNSIDFMIFFPVVTLIYAVIPRKLKCLWLLAASYYFYMCWNARYAILIAFSTLVTYGAALAVEKIKGKTAKKWVMIGGFAANLGVLFFFKYFEFALQNINKLLNRFSFQTIQNPFDILLPVGISFYTFQALGYLVDVYRGDCRAERNLLQYALFVSFFPQLVAGPIERSGNLFRQIHEVGKKKMMSPEAATQGFIMMLWGLFMKMVIADRIALFVDSVFGQSYAIGTVEAVLGAAAFAVQIYCDFGGYSAIAIGAAKVMGFELMENFNAPYFAASIADFWRRWHISLSTWFRDYVYIPLGGNRGARLRTYGNLMITFLLSGLWHGAAWTYVAWGMLHGLYRVAGDALKPVRRKIIQLFRVRTDVFSYRLGQVLCTFGLTSFAWIFFRAESMDRAFLYIKNLFCRWNPWVLFDESLYTYGLDRREAGILMAALAVLLLVDLVRYRKGRNLGEALCSQNLVFRWAVMILLAVSVIVYGVYGIDFDSSQFIYFAF